MFSNAGEKIYIESIEIGSMASLKRSLSFALFVMLLAFLALYLMPGPSVLEWKLVPPPPFINSPADCPKLEGSQAYDCIIKFALERKSDSLCAGIENAFYRDKCYSEVNAGKSDESACGKLSNLDSRGECFAKLAIEQGNGDICGKAAAQGTRMDGASDACFYLYAVGSGHNEPCGRIGSPEKSGECLYHFALLSMKPIDGCASASKEATGFCILRLAVDNQNLELCARLEGSIKDDCYFQMAALKKDQGICDYLENNALKEDCFLQFGATG